MEILNRRRAIFNSSFYFDFFTFADFVGDKMLKKSESLYLYTSYFVCFQRRFLSRKNIQKHTEKILFFTKRRKNYDFFNSFGKEFSSFSQFLQSNCRTHNLKHCLRDKKKHFVFILNCRLRHSKSEMKFVASSIYFLFFSSPRKYRSDIANKN